MTEFQMTELISLKRDGDALSAEQLRWMVTEYTGDRIPDYQMAAFLMAVIFQGMTPTELSVLTEAMLASGDVLDLSMVDAPKIDKHSTGGVGDKISIPLAPLVASCGVVVPMISGRGLGHTGGTLDKLESIPGFSTHVPPDRFPGQLGTVGVVMAGATATVVPADRKLYALRDATGTVPSVPLIVSSIMSKKLAEDIDGLVLDVKVGSGAFRRSIDLARELATTMVDIGDRSETRVVAYITDMDQPLGAEIGNANEIVESIDVLRGAGPWDVTELVMAEGAEMLVVGGVADDLAQARARLQAAIDSGKALERFTALLEAQGGDPRIVDDPGLLPAASRELSVTADRDGFVARCDALAIGRAGVRLGAGRATKEDEIDPAVGITVAAKRGDRVERGDRLATVRYNDESRIRSTLAALEPAWEISDDPPTERPLIVEVLR